jgi:hypothetical protein
MIGPGLLTEVKQRHHFSGQRVLSAGGTTFEFIAATTGEAEVFKDGPATLGLGQNVVYSHRLTGVGFSGIAIGTVSIVGLKQTTT